MRKNITIPDEWVAPLERLAKRRKISFSRLLVEAAAAHLPAAERGKLPPAKERGRPAREAAH